jgi:hypothetical protein
MPSVTGECKAYRTKMLLVVTCLTGLVMLCTACSVFSTDEIATTNHIFASSFSFTYQYAIKAELQPTDMAQANTTYQVDLYENGRLRATTTVSWNQPQINVKEPQTVDFPASSDEYWAYAFTDISHIFSVEVHE